MVTQLQGRLGNVVFNLIASCPITIMDLSTVEEEENRYWGTISNHFFREFVELGESQSCSLCFGNRVSFGPS